MSNLSRIRMYLFFILTIEVFAFCNVRESERIKCDQLDSDFKKLLRDTLDKQKTELLIKKTNTVLAENPTCNTANILLGDIYLSRKDLKRAEDFFRRATMIDPKSTYANFKLGILFQRRGKSDSAVLYLEKAESLKNINGFVLDTEEGFSDVAKQNFFDIKYSQIVFHRAIAYFTVQDYINSMYDLNYCISQNFRLGEVYYYRGQIYLRIENFKKACQDFEMAKIHGTNNVDSILKKYSCK